MKKIFSLKIAALSFFVFIFFVGCHPRESEIKKSNFPIKELSSSEKQWLMQFLEEYFLNNSAIYTLFGTKPMSCVTLNASSESEWLEETASQLKTLSPEKKEKALEEIKNYCREDSLYRNWERWIEWKKNYPHIPFLFRKQPMPTKNLYSAYVINVREVISTLHTHYAVFSRELHMDFDPVEVARDFENLHSIFWEQVLENHLLQGILYGFGERNAYFFFKQMHLKEIDKPDSVFISHLTNKASNKKDIKLPVFRSYYLSCDQDPLIEKYKHERELIIKRLKGRVFLEEALSQLIQYD